MITEYGRSGTALMWVGSANPPRYCAIGSGSGAEIASVGSLYAEVLTRRFYTTRDITTPKYVTWTYDYNSVEMSGINLRETALTVGSNTGSQDAYLIKNYPAIVFDGSNEVTIEISMNTF